MPFRFRQKFNPASSHCVCEIEEKENNDGVFVKELVRQDKSLPDPAMFDLKNILEAGVPLEEVNSKVMRSTSVNADSVVRKYTKNTEENNNKEN